MLELFILLFLTCIFGYFGYLIFIYYKKKNMEAIPAPLSDVIVRRNYNCRFPVLSNGFGTSKPSSGTEWRASGTPSSTRSSGMFTDRTISVFQPIQQNPIGHGPMPIVTVTGASENLYI